MSAAGDGIRPSLAELVALRGAVSGRRVARRGRHGVSGVADTRRELYFGTRVRFKSVQAARAGAVAAWAAVRDGDRIAALRGTSKEAPVTPASGPRGALRVLDALARWYGQPPADDAGLAVALDHARRLLRPGSRLVVLADAASIADVPVRRWPALALHSEVIVLLLTDPLEQKPPQAQLPFVSGEGGALAHRVQLDLMAKGQRQRWHAAFTAPVQVALAQLPGYGVRVQTLSTDAASESWLPSQSRRLHA